MPVMHIELLEMRLKIISTLLKKIISQLYINIELLSSPIK